MMMLRLRMGARGRGRRVEWRFSGLVGDLTGNVHRSTMAGHNPI